jgi:phage shock protein PspC (stress-responsive transcriptional regulator)
MDESGMKKCPFCAEMIRAEAIKCRYCGSMLTRKPMAAQAESVGGYWHRVSQGKQIAGVCTGLARQFDAPVLVIPLRVMFCVTTLFYGFGLVLYIVLWLLMPPPDKTGSEDAIKEAGQPYAPPAPGHARAAAPPMVDNYPGGSAAMAPQAEVPGRKPKDSPSDESTTTETGGVFDLGQAKKPEEDNK